MERTASLPFVRTYRNTLHPILRRTWRRLTWPAPRGPIFHVTHHKAGSQWVRWVLQGLLEPWLIEPMQDMRQFLSRPIAARGVYPTLYLSRGEFESVALPAGWKRFIVIRDLRDTLVSLYFSLKVSHPLISNNMEKSRGHIQDMPTEQGLLLLIRNVCERYAKQQQSWLGGPDVIYKYEDLLDRDVELFEEILIGHCGLKLSRDRLRAVVIGNRFEAHAGRQRGDEDQGSHKRKGIAGDWRNYFTDGVAKAFKDRFGEHLIATGYEKDNRW